MTNNSRYTRISFYSFKKNIKTLPLIMASQLNEPDMFISSPVSKQAWPSLPFALLSR